MELQAAHATVRSGVVVVRGEFGMPWCAAPTTTARQGTEQRSCSCPDIGRRWSRYALPKGSKKTGETCGSRLFTVVRCTTLTNGTEFPTFRTLSLIFRTPEWQKSASSISHSPGIFGADASRMRPRCFVPHYAGERYQQKPNNRTASNNRSLWGMGSEI